MQNDIPHRKRVKHYHDPGDLHELTFSCYRRLQLLTNDAWRTNLARSIDTAMAAWSLRLIAFVFMPNHVHLLVLPLTSEPQIDKLLADIKRPCSVAAKADLLQSGSTLLDKLTIRTRPGVRAFRFWQEGPGYDRNLRTEAAVLASIEYIHTNPVKSQLCKRASQWHWSSARWYESDGQLLDPLLPIIHPLPGEFFESPTLS